MTRAYISGVGVHAPKRILTNADLEKLVDTNNDWIMQRVGIRERHIAGPGVATSDLGKEAALAAIEAVVSWAAATRRSRMPVRWTIHSSLVSTIFSRSALVRTWLGA